MDVNNRLDKDDVIDVKFMKLFLFITFVCSLLIFLGVLIFPYILDPCYSVVEGKGPDFSIKKNRVCMVFSGGGVPSNPMKIRTLEGADAETFISIGNRYYVDKSYVYYTTEILPSADPASFKKIDDETYGDEVHIYRNGRLVN